MPAAISCACLVCYFSAPERKRQCESSTGTACCRQPRRRNPVEQHIPTFLSEELVQAIEPSPSNSNMHLHFPVCTFQACKVSAEVSLGDKPVRISLPTKPTTQVPADLVRVLEAEITTSYAPWFKQTGPPSLLVLRYLRLFCPASFDPRHHGPFAQARTFILGVMVLTRLSIALSDSLGAVYRCWKPGQPPDRREGAMAELSVLYGSLVETKRALVGGKAMTLLGGTRFKDAFVSSLEDIINGMLPYAYELCGQKRKWYLRLGLRNIEQLRFQHWGAPLRLDFEHCNHKKRKASAATQADLSDTPFDPNSVEFALSSTFSELSSWSFPSLEAPKRTAGSTTGPSPGPIEVKVEEANEELTNRLQASLAQARSSMTPNPFVDNLGSAPHLNPLPINGYIPVPGAVPPFYGNPAAGIGGDFNVPHGGTNIPAAFLPASGVNQAGVDSSTLLSTDEPLGFASQFTMTSSVNALG